jgi:hypothetical protein
MSLFINSATLLFANTHKNKLVNNVVSFNLILILNFINSKIVLAHITV